ncbi:hypothetical protein [Methylobacterium nigriterrae]|uniref:hypothetical protein n=1 Tax=Methylobacterium nigriterrae TaxID=3127512 RepID=UPI003013FBEB
MEHVTLLRFGCERKVTVRPENDIINATLAPFDAPSSQKWPSLFEPVALCGSIIGNAGRRANSVGFGLLALTRPSVLPWGIPAGGMSDLPNREQH